MEQETKSWPMMRRVTKGMQLVLTRVFGDTMDSMNKSQKRPFQGNGLHSGRRRSHLSLEMSQVELPWNPSSQPALIGLYLFIQGGRQKMGTTHVGQIISLRGHMQKLMKETPKQVNVHHMAEKPARVGFHQKRGGADSWLIRQRTAGPLIPTSGFLVKGRAQSGL